MAQAEVRVEGLNAVLRSLRQMPPQVGVELKKASGHIARNLMLPHYQQAARTVPVWGDVLADSIRVKRDRVPALKIGYKRAALSGGRGGSKKGASTVQLRWPTFSGDRGSSFAPFEQTRWLDEAKGYKPKAMEAWTDALERYVRKWNRGNVA